MNIQLYVENRLCDFDTNTYFTLQKEFEEEEELIVKEVEYSYTISIPTSTKNKEIFGFIDTFDVANKFGRIYDAELYVDEMLILKGKLKLSEIADGYFKGNLYNPANVTVSDILGDRMLTDIIPHMKPMNNMTDYKQQNNYTIGLSTTDIPKTQYRDRHICYPYVLYSLPYNDGNKAISDNLNFYTQNLQYGYHTMTADNVFPAFNVCSILKDMFKTEGYNLIGNIFDDEKFKDLYQTFQYSYSDFLDKKNAPYYLKFSCTYDNYRNKKIPSTLESAVIWSQNDWTPSGHEGGFNGSFEYGVDCPLTTDANNVTITEYSNDQHMLTSGESTNGRVIYIPKSGWYRIKLNGTMSYPDASNKRYTEKNREAVGGTSNGRTITDLSEQPFEIQLKKGYPLENPKLYSFNSFIPSMPTHFGDNMSSVYYDDGNGSWIKCMENERNRRYGKNQGTMILKDYSDFSISDFVCGARFGDAYFGPHYYGYKKGPARATERLATMGVGLALPNAGRSPETKSLGEDGNTYFRVHTKTPPSTYTYGYNTAQAMVREDSYSNFEGYNIVDFNTKRWDTTSNEGKKSYQGASNSTARSTSKTAGTYDVNTVVWLEKGDTLYIELLMPRNNDDNDTYHGGWLGTGHKRWVGARYHINRTMVNFTLEMGFINNDKKWVPTSTQPIPDFNVLKNDRETNVNQFLPNVKCNDYLNNFLQTFNLQLTMPTKNTFSIDFNAMNDIQGNIISIDNLANIKDAEFKALNTPSERQLTWKIDTSETGYYDGNKSPYKTDDYPWYDSGYTGSISITNETNTSGSIDKKESQWSYAWYKDIRFTNGQGLTPQTASIMVIADKEKYDSSYTYLNAESDALETSKTMRFFFLGKNAATTMYSYIDFQYDLLNGTRKDTRLLLPSNYIESNTTNGTKRLYMLDYNNSAMDNRRKTITDIFFNLRVQSGYQIDIPIKLSNNLYKRINAGTLIKFNDGLYKVMSIDGHDVMEQEDATLSLLTLK